MTSVLDQLRIYRCGCGGFHLTRRAVWVESKVA